MFRKFMKALLLAGLCWFYIQSVTANTNGWIDAIILDTVNWLVLILILYLASDYFSGFGVACVLVAALGVFVQGYKFYTVQFPSTQIERSNNEKPKECFTEGVGWYQRLARGCYK